MKKSQCFSDIESCLKNEEVPYKDNKEEILRSIKSDKMYNGFRYRKLALVSIVLLVVVITAAFTFDYIREHEAFVKEHNGNIEATLSDDEGNIVIQLGAMSDIENYEVRLNESNARDRVSKEFESISKPLEDKLPGDKIALFIPVKGLETMIDFDILNTIENYQNFEDMKKNISADSPLPAYIPESFTFSKASVYLEYDNFYEPYSNEMTYKEYLMKLFEETKVLGKDYFYKEYDRSNETLAYWIFYTADSKDEFNSYPQLSIEFKKGKMTSLADNGVSSFETETIDNNGRKYLKYDNTYYTYTYVNGELWTIEICKPRNLEVEDMYKIIESI